MIAYIRAYLLGYRKSPDGYWYHLDWKKDNGKYWLDRPWFDTPEECIEYDAITSD